MRYLGRPLLTAALILVAQLGTPSAWAGFNYCPGPTISASRIAQQICLEFKDITLAPSNQSCVDKFNECRAFFRDALDKHFDYYSQAQYGFFTGTVETEYSGPNPYKVNDVDNCIAVVHGQFLGSGHYFDKHANPAKVDIEGGYDKFRTEVADSCDPQKMTQNQSTATTIDQKTTHQTASVKEVASVEAKPTAASGCTLTSTGVDGAMHAWFLLLSLPLLRGLKKRK